MAATHGRSGRQADLSAPRRFHRMRQRPSPQPRAATLPCSRPSQGKSDRTVACPGPQPNADVPTVAQPCQISPSCHTNQRPQTGRTNHSAARTNKTIALPKKNGNRFLGSQKKFSASELGNTGNAHSESYVGAWWELPCGGRNLRREISRLL